MPTYEYRCAACQREFEVQQRMADPDLVTCEACGQDKLERLISWTSVRSDTWKAALYENEPKHAMKGTHACDLSRGPSRFTGNDGDDATAGDATADAAIATDAAPAPAPAAPAAPATTDAEPEPPAGGDGVGT